MHSKADSAAMALVTGKVGGEMIKEREELRLDSI